MAIDFPNPPLAVGTIFTFAGQSWRWDGTKWAPATVGGSIPEAPADSVTYGRKNLVWTAALALTGDILDGGNY